MSRRRKKTNRGDDSLARTGPFVHEQVLRLINEFPRGKVLDIPCGEGALHLNLIRMGFEVYCGDLDSESFKMGSGNFHVLDLNDPLPYKDAIFDCVTCIEGIEHLENPHQLIREISRILKRGGRAIITMPNIMNIKSRLYFLLRSYFNNYRYIKQPSHQKELLALHINPIPFIELKYILNQCGLTIQRISCNRYTRKYPWLLPFLMPLIRLMTRRKNREARFLLKKELLEGDILIVSVSKDS